MGWLRRWTVTGMIGDGSYPAATTDGSFTMTVSDLCLILGVLFAFATLVVKIIEVARRR
ncbi:hypothetical protein [Sphingomonas sp.]|uniref:hypothetical protein n=1 Tax=Sphingomonas sp. TaxID=28214 RepID=UPI002EDA1933